ncbi:type VII secretion integral membrane protein EccD [Prauserella cavernicola]|uniref:Type VII secretion integral membrane protein EccD n=1 Tax=Prauserella cavernicola TaxID=2800127 RepID=A0A934QP57_9PSEU|nr:type VII secretion integral membrane protein EccD [Prauserella cavernicola]MBK1783468.1 type VII secretion integral membrane protein EccD [Prauserella cavernicola]
MTVASGTALARVTIATPERSIDVALPEDVAVADLLPYILRHAGADAPDAGERHGGWVLRRPDGTRVDSRRTLGAQEVRDGEVMHLVPGHAEWPEPEYDDVVETIASGARRHGRSWGGDATRRCTLAVCAVVLAVGTAFLLVFEPPWLLPGLALLGVALVLTAAGAAVARAIPDAGAGAVLAGSGLLYALAGGWVVTGPAHATPAEFGSPQLLLAAVTVVVFGVVGYLGVSAMARVFAAAVTAGLLGVLGALLAGPLGADGSAAVVLTVGIGLLPAFPMLAIRLGRLPMPALPQSSADLLADEPVPPSTGVFAAAVRTDEMLSGLLAGLAVAGVLSCVVLALSPGTTSLILLGAVAVALLLRARLFAVGRQRVPLLVAGSVSAALVLASFVGMAQTNTARLLLLVALVAIVGLVAFAGLTYSRRNPSPYLGRIADVLDVVAILALVPLTCLLTGLFTYVQGLMAGIG